MNRKIPHAKKYPFVSVVVPAFNEELMLPSCLEALTAQDYKNKYEIIVVDNNSSDHTFKIAKVFGVKVIKEKHQGVAFARQVGFTSSKGNLLLTTDADTLVPTNWISRMVEEFQKDPKVVAIAGGFSLIGTNTLLKLISKSFAPFLFFLDQIFNYPGTLIGWNMAVRKDAFVKSGGFNLSIAADQVGEDMDLGVRLRKIGKTRKIFNIKVKTSARRYTGFFKSLKYVFLNSLYFRIKKRNYPKSFQTVREKPYDSYDSLNDLPILLTIVFLSITMITLLVGAIPSLNIWSTSSAKTKDKIIALTFDDSSNFTYTNQLLNILLQKDVKATFFVTGNLAKNHPDIVRQAFNEGNLIGNYSMSTKSTLMLNTSGAIIKDINSTDSIISNIIGVKPKFFRPPHGYRSIWGGISIDKYGYYTVTWSNSSDTGLGKITSKKIAVDIIKDVKPGDIIELQINDQSVKAAEEIIDLLQADGYKFVTLDSLLNKPGYF